MPRAIIRDAEIDKRIKDALRSGNSRTCAAGFGRISYDTFKRWFDKDELFRFLVEDAEHEAETEAVAVIRKAMQGYKVEKTSTKTKTYQKNVGTATKPVMVDVTETETNTSTSYEFSERAAEWWLERRRPKDYAQFVLDPTKLSKEQIAEFLRSEGGIPEEGDGDAITAIEYYDKPAASASGADIDTGAVETV